MHNTYHKKPTLEKIQTLLKKYFLPHTRFKAMQCVHTTKQDNLFPLFIDCSSFRLPKQKPPSPPRSDRMFENRTPQLVRQEKAGNSSLLALDGQQTEQTAGLKQEPKKGRDGHVHTGME
jgi:hypothetical protein